MGTRSVLGLSGRRSSVCTEIDIELPVVISRVWPSGADFATASAASMPVTPDLFSMTTGWPSASDRPGAMLRTI
eukprot:19294-Eustigmatos_ZCMA.PRE.1